MNKRIVELKDDQNEIILIETEVDLQSQQLVASGDNEVIKALAKFEDSMTPVINLSKSLIKQIKSLEIDKPKEIELNFAIKLSGKLDFWVISGNGEGNISLKMKWESDK